ncbi:hypothetical protein [Sorangium sp. So ce1182]|uniref:hypothetical protein n=1 Tax=Sorangium sp. So ce1182 TaxID=3133334 RepID=UPI003F61D7C7
MRATSTAVPDANEVEDGGAHAIRGFLYQFDTTLLEMVQEPSRVISFEQVQDFDDEDSFTQVKCYPSRDYAPSHIRKAVKKLFVHFARGDSRRPRLFCHFRNMTPGSTLVLKSDDLERALTTDSANYTNGLKSEFINLFQITFREDYETQFGRLCELLRKNLNVSEQGLEVVYHGMLRNQILECLNGAREDRRASFSQLSDGIRKVRAKVSFDGYSEHLDSERYIKLIRTQFVRHRLYSGPTAIPSDRLFVIEAFSDDDVHKLTAVAWEIALTVIYNPHTHAYGGPLPLLNVRGLSPERHVEFKRDLFDTLHRKKWSFIDGTPVTDHELQVRFVTKDIHRTRPRLRLVTDAVAQDPTVLGHVQEVLQFYRREPLSLGTANCYHARIQVVSSDQVLRILETRGTARNR